MLILLDRIVGAGLNVHFVDVLAAHFLAISLTDLLLKVLTIADRVVILRRAHRGDGIELICALLVFIIEHLVLLLYLEALLEVSNGASVILGVKFENGSI